MTTRNSASLSAAVTFAATLSLLGCSPPPDAASGQTKIDPTAGQPDPSGDTGEVIFELTSTPSGVQCIRIKAYLPTGTTTTKTFAVSTGSATSALSFGATELGYTTFTGDAFDVACASIGTASPSWNSESVWTVVRSGVATTVGLTLRKNYPVTTSVNFAHSVKSVVAGYTTTYLTTEVGPYWWGSLPFNRTPAAVPVLTDAQKVVAGTAHSCALRNNGTVWCWGDSSSGQCGPGVPFGSSTANPVQVTGLSNVALLSAGDWHTCAWPLPGTTAQSGPIYCWGYNGDGQLGNNSTTSSSTPVQVANGWASAFRALGAGGRHTLAVTSGGNVLSWGSNSYGQAGVGNTTSPSAFSWVAGSISGVVAVGAGTYHSCALRADGSVQCWGNNGSGQIGDGTTTQRLTPTWVTSLPGTVKQLATGGSSNCGVLVDGRITCWGDNTSGQLGNNSTTNTSVPVINAMAADADLTISMGVWHGCALTPVLDVYCWGSNSSGQLGDGTNNFAFSPVKVILP